ncbi:cytochrome P450 family protein [Solihabitans fulvus]|nr:cytochrome P450 [Solihabitans fulvus]
MARPGVPEPRFAADDPSGVGPARPGRLVSGIEAWLVTRYHEVIAALTDPRLVMSAPDVEADLVRRGVLPKRFGTLFQRKAKTLVSSDPPDHTRLRALVGKTFTARRVESMRGRAREICAGLVDEMTRAAEAGEVVDLVDSFAFPLPVMVISELMGVPAEDREDFRRWSDAIVFDQGDEASIAAYTRAAASLDEYFGRLVEAKRVDPGDDLVSGLIAAHDSGDRLDEAELRTMLSLLLIAGHETTVNLIANGVLLLTRNPAQFAALRAQPALVPVAVEEFLRHVGPVAFSSMRFTTEDVRFGEVIVPAGEVVALGLWAADHDPARFAEPHRLDVTRGDNPHLAFGHGTHFCVGASLARMEAEVAIGALVRHFAAIGLAVPEAELRWRPANTRGPVHLPVRLSVARKAVEPSRSGDAG